MNKLIDLSVTEVTLKALATICAYRYLTVAQVATICGTKPKTTSEMLLRLERARLLDHFGNTGIRGYGKTPKVYYLTKRGHALLCNELEAAGQPIPPYTQVNVTTRWSPLMYHRLETLDVLACVERDCGALQDYSLIGTLCEHRREKHRGRWRKETTDFVVSGSNPDDKIIPDAGFALQHNDSGKRALFLIEVDRGTERLTTEQADPDIATFTAKLALYDRYLASGRVKDRYPEFGQFSGFRVLVIAPSAMRIANMRAAAASLSPDFHHLYRFSARDTVSHNLLHDGWLSRDHADHSTYPLIKGN